MLCQAVAFPCPGRITGALEDELNFHRICYPFDGSVYLVGVEVSGAAWYLVWRQVTR